MLEKSYYSQNEDGPQNQNLWNFFLVFLLDFSEIVPDDRYYAQNGADGQVL